MIALPWILGGTRPSREDLTLSALIALATAFVSVMATALTAFDMARLALPETPRVYAAADTSSRPAEVRDAKRVRYLAGTTGLEQADVAGADLRDQLDVIWSNLRAKLADEGMTLDNVARVTSYLRDPAYIDTTARRTPPRWAIGPSR